MRDTSRSLSNTALPQAAVFALLVAIGVAGRWGQPEWAFTPIAAIGLLAGYALPRQLAVAAPLLAMLITDLVLPSYGSAAIAIAVYGAMAVTPMLGSLLRRPVGSLGAGVARWLGLAVSPALLFFLTTNLAVWAATSHYPKTAAGFVECYAAAIPFFKRMLAGDLTYATILFAAAALAGAYSLRGVSQEGDRVSSRVVA